jgi:hypothetical protein
MIDAPAHVTIATSSGVIWLALIIHFGGGLLGLASGAVAVAATKAVVLTALPA